MKKSEVDKLLENYFHDVVSEQEVPDVDTGRLDVGSEPIQHGRDPVGRSWRETLVKAALAALLAASLVLPFVGGAADTPAADMLTDAHRRADTGRRIDRALQGAQTSIRAYLLPAGRAEESGEMNQNTNQGGSS